MKVIAIERYGKPDVLRLMDLPKPACPDDKALIRNHAAGLNPIDYRIRQGQLKFLTGRKFPRIIGSDFCGEIAEVGKHVTDFKNGDKVYGFVNAIKTGSYAEYVQADPSEIALTPGNLSLVETASLPIAALTSLQAFIYQAKIQPGQDILINGCTGGVGSFAIQIGKALGAKISGMCSASNMDLARQLGCDHVYDYRIHRVKEPDQKYDLIFDAAAVYSFPQVKAQLKPHGMFITTIPGFSIYFFQGITKLLPGRKAAFTMVKSKKEYLEVLNRLIESHQVKPVIESTYTMDTIIEAHQKLEEGHTRGKRVLKI